MKIGVKIHPDNKEYAKRIERHVDFYEVVVSEGKKYDFIKRLRHPFFLHSEDFKYQTNLCNPDVNSANEKYLAFVYNLLKEYKAEYIILNPGIRFNNRCSLQNVMHLLRKFNPKKFLIENQPPLKNKTYPFFARDYDEIHQFLRKSGANFCLDFDHAFATAFFFEKDPIKFCTDLLDLKPKNVHLSNGRNDSFIDSHLHFPEGDFNMMAMKEIVPEDMWVTIDTANDFEEQLEEIRFLRST